MKVVDLIKTLQQLASEGFGDHEVAINTSSNYLRFFDKSELEIAYRHKVDRRTSSERLKSP